MDHLWRHTGPNPARRGRGEGTGSGLCPRRAARVQPLSEIAALLMQVPPIRRRLGIPRFPVELDVASGGSGIEIPEVAAEPAVERENGAVAAEIEQPVE